MSALLDEGSYSRLENFLTPWRGWELS